LHSFQEATNSLTLKRVSVNGGKSNSTNDTSLIE
jgi:hypothetical protein